MTAPTVDTPQGDEALFARILDLRHWTSNTAGADKRHDCKCEDCKAIKQVVHLARQAVATSQSKRAKQLAEMESALLAARREVEAARYAIPSLTGCCLTCGDRLDITQGQANDVTCVRVRPHCACNQGVHLWQSLDARDAFTAALAATPEEKNG